MLCFDDLNRAKVSITAPGLVALLMLLELELSVLNEDVVAIHLCCTNQDPLLIAFQY